MGHRPTFQEAMDPIADGRVHGGRRPPMGPPQTERESDQLYLWGDSGRLHVLADRQTLFRLVPRTSLRLQFCRRPPAIHRYERRSPHRNSVIVRGHGNVVSYLEVTDRKPARRSTWRAHSLPPIPTTLGPTLACNCYREERGGQSRRCWAVMPR